MSFRDKFKILYIDHLPDDGLEINEVIKIKTTDYVVTKIDYRLQPEIRLEKLKDKDKRGVPNIENEDSK